MKQKIKSAPYPAFTFMALLLFLTVVYVVADTYFGVTSLLLGENALPAAGYVGLPAPLSVQVPTLVGSLYVQDDLPDPALFTCDVTYVYHPTAPAATILEQSPAGGAYRKITPDDPCPLSLVVSMGKEQALLPDLSGMDVREAENLLGTLGLCPQRVYVPSGRTQDKVLSTEPSAGTLIDVGQSVVLEVSQTTPKTALPCPDLVGLTLQEAQVALASAGLSLGEVHESYILDPWGIRTGDMRNVILAQGHAPGSYLPQGYGVDVTVNFSS